MRSNKAEEILDAAERMTRKGGYGGFSFRDIAGATGIKSASVHYHFPTKEDLGAAMTERYTDRFLESLGDPADPSVSAQVKIDRYIDAFRQAHRKENLMCLCGVLGAEISGLPEQVAVQTRIFFEKNRKWLATAMRGDPRYDGAVARNRAALALIAKLEGAILMTRTMEDPEVFEAVVRG